MGGGGKGEAVSKYEGDVTSGCIPFVRLIAIGSPLPCLEEAAARIQEKSVSYLTLPSCLLQYVRV